MSQGRTTRAALAAVGAFGLLAATLIGSAAPASAAPTSDVTIVPIATASSSNLGGYTISGVIPTLPPTDYTLHITAHSTWSGHLTTAVGYESDDVRQGANLGVARSAPLTDGAISTAWQITGTVNPLQFGDVSIGTINASKDNVSCAPALAGGNYTCTATSDGISIWDTPGVPASVWVDLVLEVTYTITPEGAIVSRTFSIGGKPQVGPDDLTLGSTPDTETIAVPCSSAAGQGVTYGLGPVHWTPDSSASQQPAIQGGIRDPIVGAVQLPAIIDEPVGSPIVTNPAFDLAGDGHTTDMGPLLANNVKPTVDSITAPTGGEGSPITFSTSTTQQCPIESYVWSFSDGTTSYGASPQRAFGDDGPYNGQLTITDITGLSATKAFNFSVTNVLPTANAGPNTSGAWGKPIAFTGQAVDPGWVDQSTLSYEWDWGDGTPGTSGANATHTYALPSLYHAKLTVCDDHGCADDTTDVTVTARATTTSYTGPNTGVFSAPVTLQASVIDEFGSPVPGASVAFGLGGAGVGAGLTNGSGTATRTTDVTMAAGPSTVDATFAGSTLYTSSTSTEAFDVTRMSSLMTYTGATSGGPNKTVSLSAKLVDGLGRPLAGKPVVFTLGSQTTLAVNTGANGVATTSLKLSQKNGKYTVTASWTPAGTDADRWTGDDASAAFSLQAK